MSDTKVMTGKVRLSYVNLFEPRSFADGSVPKYSVSLIIPKDDVKTLNAVKAAIQNVVNGQNWTPAQKAKADFALRDGDSERPEDEAYRNSYFLNAKSNTKPTVVDAQLQVVDNPDVVYSGCYGRAALTFYPYDFAGKKGVGCGLRAVQKIADGEPLGSTFDISEFDDGTTTNQNPFGGLDFLG